MSHYPSLLLERAVEEFAKLPGIGTKTAMRLVLHLLRQDARSVEAFGNSIIRLRQEVKFCHICHNISDNDTCDICANPKRDSGIICVVQDIRDVIAIENTHQYQGVYHVLGGVISPMDGIGIQQLTIKELFDRVEAGGIKEIILALPATVEGDTTNFFIYKNIQDKVPTITTIARGIGVGEELEYADEATLGRSLLARTEFEKAYGRNDE